MRYAMPWICRIHNQTSKSQQLSFYKRVGLCASLYVCFSNLIIQTNTRYMQFWANVYTVLNLVTIQIWNVANSILFFSFQLIFFYNSKKNSIRLAHSFAYNWTFVNTMIVSAVAERMRKLADAENIVRRNMRHQKKQSRYCSF